MRALNEQSDTPPEPLLQPYEVDYRWLSQVYVSVQPATGTGKLLWHALGAKTIEAISKHFAGGPVEKSIAVPVRIVDAASLK